MQLRLERAWGVQPDWRLAMPWRVETGRRCPTVRIMLYWRPFSLFKALAMSARKLLSAALLVLVSPLAMAHAHLTHPVPAADASVAAPAQVSLGFSEAIEVGFSKVTLTAAGGEPVALQPLASAVDDRKTLLVKPAAPLAAGQYTVHWQVVSVDTHKSAGEYRFTVSP